MNPLLYPTQSFEVKQSVQIVSEQSVLRGHYTDHQYKILKKSDNRNIIIPQRQHNIEYF